MALPIKKQTTFMLGDPAAYTSGFTLPEGDYVWTDLNIVMHDGFGDKKLTPRLGLMIDMVPITDPTAKPHQQFYSFGSSAHLSWMPNPETGKTIVPVSGGPGGGLNDSTNWAVLRKSLYDSGLPVGIFQDDVSVLEGIWVHMMNVPEPAERAGFASKTGEGDGGPRKNNQIAIVSEIKDDGKPWEGSGGMPDIKATGKPIGGKVNGAAAKAGPKLAPKPAVKVVEPEPEEEAGEDEAVLTAAINGVSSVLEKSPAGCPKLTLKTGTFKAVQAAEGPDMAQAVGEMLNTDEGLDAVLGRVSYKLAGTKVVPIS